LQDWRRLDAGFTEYHANAADAAMISLVSGWRENGVKHSPAQMADVAQNLCDKILAAT
jgi:hypothetical protein